MSNTSGPVQPFSNGLQYYDWLMYNCDQCRRQPENWDHRSEADCAIFDAISIATIEEQTVSTDIAKRMGYEDDLIYTWRCSEFEVLDALIEAAGKKGS